jgi:hypothetical protein
MPITAIAALNFSDMACSLSLWCRLPAYMLTGKEHGRTIPLAVASLDGQTPRRRSRRPIMSKAHAPDATIAGGEQQARDMPRFAAGERARQDD